MNKPNGNLYILPYSPAKIANVMSEDPALLTPVGYQRYNCLVFVSTTTLAFVSALCCFDGPAARTTGAEVVQVKGLRFKSGVKH